MILPAILFIILFSYVPMYGALMAFQDYSIFNKFADAPWVGFKHFNAFFNSPNFWEVMRNTLVISLLKFIFTFPTPIILAIMLNEVRKMAFKRVVQTVTYLPHFMSWVIVAGFTMSILSTDNGTLNMMLEKIGLIDEPINWLTNKDNFWGILVSVNLWKEIGFSSIIYLAAISGINQDMYEAASLDGASKLKQIYYITIPSIMPVVIVFMILAIGNLLSAGFDDILLLANNPALLEVADVLDTYVYRVGVQNARYSYATAVGLFEAVISITLLVGANYFAKKSGNSLW